MGVLGNRSSIVSLSLGIQLPSSGRRSPAWTVKRARVGFAMVTFWSWMENVRTSILTVLVPGLADRRVNITYRWIRNHIPSCPVAAGVLGSLPTCAHGSPVLGPVARGVPIPELVFLGLLVTLVCGLLIVLLTP